MKEESEQVKPGSAPIVEVEPVEEAQAVEEEEKPFYGQKRYDIVDEVLGKI